MDNDKNLPKDNIDISTANNIFLPHIPLYLEEYFRKNLKSKAKNPRRMHWYTDYYIEMPQSIIDEIVALMNERRRFAGLQEYVQKLLRTQGQQYRTRFIVDAQTKQDCYLAAIYINHYFGMFLYHEYFYFDYSKTYKYHTDWRNHSDYQQNADNESHDGLRVKTADKKDDENTEAGISEPVTQPVWRNGRFPMYIDSDSYDFAQLAAESELVEKYDLIYVFESREPVTMGMGGDFGFGFDGCIISQPTRNPEDALTMAGFKRIYIPDAESDELRDLFEKTAASMNMKLSKNLKFDILKKEYGKFLQTESDILSVTHMLREQKLFESQLQTSISYKDFCSVLDMSAARKEYISKKSPIKSKIIRGLN